MVGRGQTNSFDDVTIRPHWMTHFHLNSCDLMFTVFKFTRTKSHFQIFISPLVYTFQFMDVKDKFQPNPVKNK